MSQGKTQSPLIQLQRESELTSIQQEKPSEDVLRYILEMLNCVGDGLKMSSNDALKAHSFDIVPQPVFPRERLFAHLATKMTFLHPVILVIRYFFFSNL